MKVRNNARRWMGFALSGLLALGLAAPMGMLLTVATPTPASANSELHPGGRLFFPAWDVQGARLSFMIITRLSMFEKDQNTNGELKNGIIDVTVDPNNPIAYTFDGRNNCQPFHTSSNIAQGGVVTVSTTNNKPADDVHLEWYGKSCLQEDEVLKMSCADIDLIFLSAGNIAPHYNKGDQQGALDVHFVINGNSDKKQRVNENSLMGYGVIADPTQGWVAAYPAAAAKSTQTTRTPVLDGGSAVGYEPFPTEVFIPFALADGTQGGLANELYLWAPTFFPGALMPSQFGIDFNWFDGRERRFNGSTGDHSIIEFLDDLDARFFATSFTCSTTTLADIAENDGAPGVGTPGVCTDTTAGSGGTDASHPSDNGQTAINGFTSTSIGWWDIEKTGDDAGFFSGTTIQAVRGLVGVVISRTGTGGVGNGDAIRLWHKDPCEVAPKGEIGPPHLRDRAFSGNDIVEFNTLTQDGKYTACGVALPAI